MGRCAIKTGSENKEFQEALNITKNMQSTLRAQENGKQGIKILGMTRPIRIHLCPELLPLF